MNEPANSDRTRARLYLSSTAREAAEFARSIVPTYADRHSDLGEHLTVARRLRLMAERVIDAAMAVEAAEGATQADLVAWLALPDGTVQMRMAEVKRHVAAVDPDLVAPVLDRWYAETGGPDAPADAVSTGLHHPRG